ncbi:helix-turn-helix domain-containing protein [Streptomyces sp. SID12501]|uniref:Helix-turn-helix domain-containing protein n=1 Tax=Streptomyces sp. SID12501 TaxID=2706042 RepID=A0A6B3BL46_9ACTN|nr:helix-turn-helix domain-containing protein [Streptomyces sp. SID12501]NEC84729.1 helix-turn-helix domain-containing protein [Streptomyces sp. SID12501]
MPRPPALPPEEKVSILLAILAGETTAADAARQAGVSAQAVSAWKKRFIEAGRTGLESAPFPTAAREQELAEEVNQLRKALSDSYLQYQAMRQALTRPGTRQGTGVLRQQRPASLRPLLAG